MNGKNDSARVLTTAYNVLEQEFTRIYRLLNSADKNSIGGYVEIIRSQFNDFLSEGINKINKINQAIQENSPERVWNDYVEMKTKLMPILSSELLAVIGGVYLRENKLEELDGDQKIHLSSSKMAEDFVKDLAKYSGKNWQSVLIVGEELFRLSEAEIIRLRFPACNIWHLPFIAHEYGYLVARKDTKVPPSYRDLRDKVRLDVDPRKHLVGTLPENPECFLAEIVSLWKNYHDLEKLPSEDERQEFLKTKRQRLITLADEQESFLCRLFADAFATFFIGPAYIHALLNLRFSPGDSPSPGIPPFDHRFIFALEILKWMNDEPITDPKKNRGAFVREVFEQEGIPFLWRQTLKSLGITDQYSEILIKYTPWLNHIKQALKSHFAAGVEFTYNNWNIAKELEKKIIEPNPKIDSYPEIVAILNAAWTARGQHPESIKDIQINALRLLAKDQSLLEPLQPKSGSGPGRAPVSTAPTKRGSLITEERGSLTTEECINIVQGALFDKVDQKAINLFSLMKKISNFYNCNDIEDILKDNEKAVKAFQQLCDAKSQSKF